MCSVNATSCVQSVLPPVTNHHHYHYHYHTSVHTTLGIHVWPTRVAAV